ncbi:hypothetical protein Lepto7375DRAFT_1872 [Leptolyngbya sp. PCC 7375]|nr:hypothetical protein Lepto7375DRAFT_1872 [Leptolyngbya sp. PCC 7375]
MEFEWDPDKAAANFEKHGVSFQEAATVFNDPLSITFPDPVIQLEKIATLSLEHQLLDYSLVVAHTDRDQRLRIISARKATRKERTFYEEGF